jgi:hypothetical protein
MRNGRSQKLAWPLPAGTTNTAPPPTLLSLPAAAALAAAAAATGTPRAMGRDVALLAAAGLGLTAANTSFWRALFQSDMFQSWA